MRLRPRLTQTMRTVEVEDADEAIDAFSDSLWEMTLDARAEAFQAGADFAADQASEFGYRIPEIPQPGYPPASVKTIIRENWRGQQPWERVADRIETHVRDAARQSVIATVDEINEDDENVSVIDTGADDGADDFDAQLADLDDELDDDVVPLRPQLGWSRVLGPNDNHCSFCIMLAARGPVYSSAEAAGQVAASRFWSDASGFINSYHDNCRCKVVMVPRRGKWAGWDQVRALEGLYELAVERVQEKHPGKASGKHYRENLVLQELDLILKERADEGSPVEIPEYAA